MLKVLLKDGTELDATGRVKFYDGEQPALCNFDFSTSLTEEQYNNVKIVFDTETEEFVYIRFCSMSFYKSEKYIEMYARAIREIELIKNFIDKFKIWTDTNNLNIDINDLAEWLVFEEDNILSIFNSVYLQNNSF